MAGKPWFAWEWLYDLVVGELESWMGLDGVVWLTGVVIAAVFAWTFRLLMRRGVNLLVAFVMVLLALASSMIHFLARPHVVSWLFTLAWFWILDSSERECFNGQGGRGRRSLWILPPLILVWVNVHGGFLMGFVLLGIFWLGALWTWFRAKPARIEEALLRIAAQKRSRDLIFVCLLTAAASLVNPYGWKLHAHIYSYLSNRFLMDHIEEFQSPNFHGLGQRCFVVLLLIVLAALAAWGRKLRMSEALLVLFAVYAGLYASRNIPVCSLLLVMVVAPLILPAMPVQGFLERMQRIELSQRGHLWPVAVLIVTLGIAANGGRLGPTTLIDAHFDPKRMPVEAVNYMQQSAVTGPILGPDYWGGYLIYRLYPAAHVIVDDRHDLYGEEFFKSYLWMIQLHSRWDNFLHEHEARCLVLPRDAALTSLLMEMQMPYKTPDWIQVYADQTAVVFVRRKQGTTQLVPK